MNLDPNNPRRAGFGAGIAAYVLWGLFPLYWPLLKPAGALEILAHRIVWSFVSVVVVLLALRAPWGWVRAVFTKKAFWPLLAASVLIAINWLVYIFAVNTGHVVEGSLGYFINPLVNVVLGVWLFGERMNRLALVGILAALGGVTVIAWGSWQTLWISLLLAASFGLYGVAKKRAHLSALQGLAVESGFLALPCAAYLGYLAATGAGQFGVTASGTSLLALAGPITALPLWLFAIAAPRLPFGVVGILQYLAPTIQFLLGVTVMGEHVTASYWAGLVGVWIGSVCYLASVLRPGRARAA